jgi:hypothetical protein
MESDWQEELADLRHHWGSAYLINCFGLGTWVAQRHDSHGTLGSQSAEGLLEAIREDYQLHPVPRDPRPCLFRP